MDNEECVSIVSDDGFSGVDNKGFSGVEDDSGFGSMYNDSRCFPIITL